MKAASDYRPGLRLGRRTLVSDIDGTLLDDGVPGVGSKALGARLREADAGLVLSSGRNIDLAEEAAETLQAGGLPRPSGLICGVGTEIYLADAGRYVLDGSWRDELLASGFAADEVTDLLSGVAHLRLQPQHGQSAFKVSYFVEPTGAGGSAVQAAQEALESADVRARLVYSAGRYLDVLPFPASKGAALLHLASRFELASGDVVVAGDSGNDRELLITAAAAGMVAVLVGNHEPEVADLRRSRGVLAAVGALCEGVLEGIDAAGWPARA